MILNNDDGRYSEAIDLPGGISKTYFIEATEINGDGMVDIIVGNIVGQNNHLLMNGSHGAYSEAIDIDLVPNGNGNFKTNSILVADVNGDGMVDIIIGNYGENNQLMLNIGDGSYKKATDLPGGATRTKSIAIVDLNGDGIVDILIGNWGQNNQVLISERHGTYSEAIDLPGGALKTTSIAAADVNGDNRVDILVGNYDASNQILMSEGDGSYANVIRLPGPGISSKTNYIVSADVNGDGMVDIIIGNYGQSNELHLNNGYGGFYYRGMFILPGGAMKTYSIAVADINGDGMVDIIFGNDEESNQLVLNTNNDKSGLFYIDLPGGTLSTRSIATADVNGDGAIDIIVGNYDKNNHLLMNKGDVFHVEFEAADLPGRVLKTSSIAAGDVNGDGMVDIIIGNYGQNNQVGLYDSCPNGGAQLHPRSWCFNCPLFMGRDISVSGLRSYMCRECMPDYVQQDGYSDQCESSLSCPLGKREIGEDSCLTCSNGTYYNNQISRVINDPTTWDAERCVSCPSGTYASNNLAAIDECFPCRPGLTSPAGSSSCCACDQGLYLDDIFSKVDCSGLQNNPSKYCLVCPSVGAVCKKNSTLSELHIESGYWRHSNRTSTIYACNNNSDTSICIGGDKAKIQRKRTETNYKSDYGDNYCREGHKGPLCEVCTNQNFYFDDENGECAKCPTSAVIFLHFFIICLVAVVLNTLSQYTFIRLGIDRDDLTSSLDLEAKLKILVSFCQILSSFEEVYGVKLDSRLADWTEIIFMYLSLDFLHIIGFSASCVSSTIQQIIIGAVWPYVLVFMGIIAEAIYRGYKRAYRAYKIMRRGRYSQLTESISNQESILGSLKLWATNLIVVVFYLSLPTVSNTIFTSIKCRSFDDDDQGSTVSYLVADMEIQCDSSEDSTYSRILITFWVFFVIWTILTPLGFFVILKSIHQDVVSRRLTSLADACSFLWEDYKPSMIYWDVVDTLRKIFLTGCIMFIDINEGSNKMLRLVIANAVSVLYSFILLAFNPYKRKDNYYLAFLSNFLLIYCFSLGVILKHCNEEDSKNLYGVTSCTSFIGKSLNSFRASILVVVLTFGMLFITINFVLALAVKKFNTPTAYMVSTGDAPKLDLPEGCRYHLYFSYAWETGQTRTDEIVEKVRALLPGLQIWLDVEQLVDTYQSENAIERSAVFAIYYSRNYFQYKKEELCKAIELEKPIIFVYEGNRSIILKELYSNSDDAPIPDIIIQKLLGENYQDDHNCVIQWSNESPFFQASIKRLYENVLSNLPYYKVHHDELDEGIRIPGEIEPVLLRSSINILVCECNYGCLEIAQELEEVASEHEENSTELINIQDALFYFGIKEDEEELLLGDRQNIVNSADMPTFLLLYLNEYTFTGDDEDEKSKLISIIRSCIEHPDINILLLHEQDSAKGGCSLDSFYQEGPQELINHPYNLFQQCPIKLYSSAEFRILSLRSVLSAISNIGDTNSGTKNSAKK